MSSLQAAIFDFDGVLFDTEKQHEICWKRVAENHGKRISRDQFLLGFGLKNNRFINEVLQWSDDPSQIALLSEEKERFFQEYITQYPLSPISGTHDLLMRLYKEGIKCVIGSSSIRKNIDIILSFYPDIRDAFIGIISGEEILYGKPDPDVFIKAALLAKSPPYQTIVLEDAPLGIRAAKAASMKVIGLTTTFSEKRLQEEKPDAIFSDFSSLSVATLVKL